MALLDEYIVGVDGPWSDEEAAHLWRRAGFGATPSERTTAVGAGDQVAFQAAVDALVNTQPQDPYLDQPAGTGTGAIGDPLADLPNDTSDLGLVKTPISKRSMQAHWIYRMRYTSQPLQEQLTLFLHDHMVSEWVKVTSGITSQVNQGNDGVPPPTGFQSCTTGTLPYDPLRRTLFAIDLLMTQNYLFRATGIDDFRQLLINITRDPCMLLYLDNVLNRKGRAQENYAREVMELFSMGVGNYSENDVQEVAKCFTGETLPLRGCSNDYQYDVYGFDPALHEPGNKTVFGQTITFDGTGQETVDVIDKILAKVSVNPDVSGLTPPYNTLPAAAVYMAWKLLQWFVGRDFQLSPTPDLAVLELADYMRGTDAGVYPQRRYPYDVRAVLRKLFLSKLFVDSAYRYNLVKTPADYVVMALRMIGIGEGFAQFNGPADRMADMGMSLFEPPNVAGWNHGNTWITSGNVIQRFNYANRIGQAVLNGTAGDAWLDNLLTTNGWLPADPADHPAIIDYFATRLIQIPLTLEEQTALTAFLDTYPLVGSGNEPMRNKIRGIIHMLMAMPRFQLK
ncbi:MAG: DUF1800 family protein [Candidatus Hydrogenedentes bacterium]|nr:DUF1800 family protein [Candidatus Hydrogenedentota bacterium]